MQVLARVTCKWNPTNTGPLEMIQQHTIRASEQGEKTDSNVYALASGLRVAVYL